MTTALAWGPASACSAAPSAPSSRMPPSTILASPPLLASVSMALFLMVLKSYAAWTTGSVAMLGSLADTALDLAATRAKVLYFPGSTYIDFLLSRGYVTQDQLDPAYDGSPTRCISTSANRSPTMRLSVASCSFSVCLVAW